MRSSARAAIGVLLCACASQSSERAIADSVATDSVHPVSPIAVQAVVDDSCTMGDPTGEVCFPPVAPGRWSDTRVIRTDELTMEPPTVATRIERRDSQYALALTDFPQCGNGCHLSVRLIIDSLSEGVDAHVAKLLREEARVDSLNSDPRREVSYFNNYDPPAKPFTTPGGPGVFLEGVCGDCSSGSLFFGKKGWIAEVRYSVDDRQPVRYDDHLIAVAKTFRWVR